MFHAGERGTYNQTLFRAPFAGDVASAFAESAQVRQHRSFANLPLIFGVLELIQPVLAVS